MLDGIATTATLALAGMIATAGCSNGARRVDPPIAPVAAPVDAAPVADPIAIENPSTAFVAARPAGVKPIAVAEFVTFLGIHHGDTEADVLALLPATDRQLGQRTELDIMGSEGYAYPSHFTVSWLSETAQIDYVSVKSDAAIAYLAAHGRRDAKLDTLWGASPQAVLGILGQPTESVELPHAWTFRFDFAAGGRAGTLSLEFSKLADTLGCSAVSVHYRY